MAIAATPKTKATPPTAIVPATLSHDQLLELLDQAGALPQSSSDFHRLSLKAGVLETDDGDMFPPLRDKPSLTVRIVTPPVYYNAFFLSDNEENGAINAARVGRADLNGRFARKYDDPTAQANDTNPANDLYDDLATLSNRKGAFKADLQVQIVPPDGQLTGEETIYTLTLSTTSIFEWRGSTRAPGAGSVSDENFIVKLAKLAVAQAAEGNADETGQKQAVLNAMVSLRLGGVVADIYLLRAENDKKTLNWWVLSFIPIHIEPPDDTPALAGGSEDAPF